MYFASPCYDPKHVISTGGGAFCRRSGETPVFHFYSASGQSAEYSLLLPSLQRDLRPVQQIQYS